MFKVIVKTEKNMRTISNIKLENDKTCTNISHVSIYCKTSINLVIGITYSDVKIEFA